MKQELTSENTIKSIKVRAEKSEAQTEAVIKKMYEARYLIHKRTRILRCKLRRRNSIN